MKLETPDSRLFSLTIKRYEFPDEKLGPTEDNPAEDFELGRFLIVAHTFRNSDGEWNTSGPTMTTEELYRFAEWLDSLCVGNPSTSGFYFTERELEFTFDDVAKNLQVHASFGFLPPWNDSGETVTIEFPLAQIDLEQAVISLQNQLARFPGRPPIGSATEQR